MKLDKKLGPLELWQWAALGAAAGVLLLLYNRRRGTDAAAASTGAATPADAQYDVGPIDPTTGLPFAGGGAGSGGGGDLSGGIAQNAAPMSLADELNDFGLIVGLLSSIQGTQPVPATDTTAGSTQDQPAQATGTQPTSKAEPAPGFHKGHSKGHDYYLTGIGWVSRAKFLAGTVKSNTMKPKSNPGHTVTTKSGKQTARSTAPHSKEQHKNVAPPAHQRHTTTSHASQPKAHIEHGNAPVAQHPARQNTTTKKKTTKKKTTRRRG